MGAKAGTMDKALTTWFAWSATRSAAAASCRDSNRGGQHEFDKRRAVSPVIRFGKRGTVGFLSVPDHCFPRQKSEQGTPLPQNERLPQAPIAVGTGMDQLQFAMHNA
jgi:hypothetical protein